MTASYAQEIKIEDIGNHPEEIVAALCRVLSSGAPATPDPKRPGFFEIDSGSRIFYFYDSPVSGKILLLATWPADPSRKAASQAA
ncbi:MAG: hypothetical protein ACREQC_07435 [Candidatus Binataceae bacterium]